MDPVTHPHETAAEISRDTAIRGTVAIGLLGVALIHVLDGIGKYGETRYLFWMFMGLVLSSIAVAGVVLFTRSRTALLAAAALTASALAGYALSRTTGLPNATSDIGNWSEPIGVANVFLEATIILVALPGYALAARSGRARSGAPAFRTAGAAA